MLFNLFGDNWMKRKGRSFSASWFIIQLLVIAIIFSSIFLLVIVDANSQQIKKQKKGTDKVGKVDKKKDKDKEERKKVKLDGQKIDDVTMGLEHQEGHPESRLTDEQRLFDQLFQHYDRYARPVFNLTDAVTISMSLTITQIFEMDEKNQVLITNAWANLEWVDQYLRWDPEDYSGLKMVRIISSKLWLPDIVLYNNAADFSPNVLETRAMVSSNGLVFWSVPTKLFSSCKIDVTYFPFDEQKCRMKFGSWTYDGFKLDLVNSSTTADLSLYIKSGEWDLISAEQRRNVVIYTCCIEPYPDVTFYLHIKRKPLYYTVNVFLPCLLMSGLTLLVFLLPAESGEKCGLGITIMLSFAVFMLTVIEKLPDTSESFPLISVYLTVVMSTTAVSIVITVSLLNLNHKTSRSAPVRPWLKHALEAMAPFCCIALPPSQSADSVGVVENTVANKCHRAENGTASDIIIEEAPPYNYFDAEKQTVLDDYGLRQQLRRCQMRKRNGSIVSSSGSDATTSGSISSCLADMTLSPVELLRLLTFELNETARASTDSGNSLGQTYHQVAFGLHRLLDREQKESEVQDSVETWRRLAQLIDRVLFWLLLVVVVFFTVFLLVISPSQKLL